MTMTTMVPFLSRSVPAPVDFGDGTYSAAGKRREVTEADVVHLLQTSAEFVSAAVLILYSRQTEDERRGHFTTHDNRVGFNKFDADRGSRWGKWVLRDGGNYRAPSFMLGDQRCYLITGQHLSHARKTLHKYRKQLAAAINAM